MRQKPFILKREVVAHSELFCIERVHLQFSNQTERIFERMLSGRQGAVLVVPILADDTLVLVCEYAAGTDRYELGFPKGIIEIGETPIEAANRELKEEIGYGSRKIEILREMTAVPGYWGGRSTILCAQDLYPEKLIGDEPEPPEVVFWQLSNYQALLAQENFSEARSIAALMLVKEKLHG